MGFRGRNKKNPFEKFLGPEDHFQKKVIDLMRWQYKGVKYHHSPNEGKRSPFERFKFSWLGGDSGFPDIIIPKWLLVMELKCGDNKPSPAQWEWIDYFNGIGWDADVYYTMDAVEKVLKRKAEQYNYFASSDHGNNNRETGPGEKKQ